MRTRKGLGISNARQMYIASWARCARDLGENAILREICREAGGEYYRALTAYVTSDMTPVAVSLKYNVSRATLYRVTRKFYLVAEERIFGE